MELDLVHRRGDAGGVGDAGQVCLGEVGDADRSDQALLLAVDERPPRLRVQVPAGVRPVDQMEVYVVGAEALERAADRGDRVVVRVVASGHLRGDPHLLAGQPGAANRLAHLALVLVVHRGVEQAVAGLECLSHRLDAVLAPQRDRAEADRREGGAVVERVRRDVGHSPNLTRLRQSLS
jgi:hypothetical protein